MKRTPVSSIKCSILILALAAAAPALATQHTERDPPADQQKMMEAWQKASTPGPQHRQLAEHFVGTWDTQQTMWMDPAAPPIRETGKEVGTAEFGGRHIRSEFSSRFMDQPFHGRALASYDNTTGKYVVSWVDDMSTGHYLAQGDYDPDTSTYTFHGEMADPMQPERMVKVRQLIRIESPDRQVMEWHETHDSNERKTMEIVYTRAK